MNKINNLVRGFNRFCNNHNADDNYFKQLLIRQNPETLIIACSDSRVDPSILFDTKLGEIFVVRNVANLVPPYQPDEDSYHGTSAAIEFAVNELKVKNIILLGHSGCAGIKCLVDTDEKQSEYSFVRSWVNIAREAKNKILKDTSNKEKYSSCEKESIKVSHDNLLTFPWIKEKYNNNKLNIYGWYFSISEVKLYNLEKDGNFKEIAT